MQNATDFWKAVALAAILHLATFAAWADETDELYQARAITTGTGEKNRRLGFEQCLRQVVVKLTGNQDLLERPAFGALLADPGGLVASFGYRDRYSGIPLHDEQGSNDRPHDLTCIYDPNVLDAAVATLGGKPWLTARPRLRILLAVDDNRQRFALSNDGPQNPAMADSLTAAAKPLALSISIPSQSDLATARIGYEELTTGTAATAQFRMTTPADVNLVGTLRLGASVPGWLAKWQLNSGGRAIRWQVEGVNFDEAFRVGLRGAAQILSGNGAPH